MSSKSLQETYAPKSICYGCGPANAKGLRIRSFESGSEIICEWSPETHYEAFSGMLNGGIIGTLLDCHCNWTAAINLKKKFNLPDLPCTVTAEYTIKLLRPTPSNTKVYLRAKVIEYVKEDRAIVMGELIVKDKITATCQGLFVAVKPGHPAYHRWG
ncbi:MAG: thioesterase [Bdellovibrionales bacterium RBG_16_40_8]|nr:MAG: thioesterase [Bdellovibrionales bacterium RBG_16_40_8]